MKKPQLSVRDLVWLVLVVAIALGWCREVSRSRKLAMELKYLKSSAPPVEFIETPLEQAIHFLSWKHHMQIEVDWESLKAEGITRQTKITHNLVDGSLPYAMQRLFLDYENVHVVSTEDGILITAKDVAGAERTNE